MELFGLNEIQWLIATIMFSGIFYNIGKYIGISDAIEYFHNDE
mgnify:FL=1|tara:strand:- start:694 stop:822 length:129 start_codon:yes stop_codon:yes gene_type:complete